MLGAVEVNSLQNGVGTFYLKTQEFVPSYPSVMHTAISYQGLVTPVKSLPPPPPQTSSLTQLYVQSTCLRL